MASNNHIHLTPKRGAEFTLMGFVAIYCRPKFVTPLMGVLGQVM